MTRIGATFKELRKISQAALIPFIMAGDPNVSITKSLVLEMAERGADIIELGVPFSEPVADGPTIQKAGMRALAKKTSLKDVLSLVGRLRTQTEIPLILMTYYNPIYRYGIEKFVANSAASGLDGTIIVDLPPEEAGNLIFQAARENLDTIFFISPTTTPKRARLINQRTKGFVYYVSLLGVTGAREKLSESLIPELKRVRRFTDKPIAVGFGISNLAQAQEVARYADGVIVGSAIVSLIEKNNENPGLVRIVGDFVAELSRALK
jgi:tryptophan synthase alpha chain